MGLIFIEGLRVFGHHGVFLNEKINGQSFVIDCTMEVDFEAAAASDNLDDTVHYGLVCQFIGEYFKNTRHDLLEVVADELATGLLLNFGAIKELTIKINKPDAPIEMDFAGVGVSLKKGWSRVAIALGSNMGDRLAYLNDAVSELKNDGKIRNLILSDFIETEPYGYTEQGAFLNGAAVFETIYSPHQLLGLLNEIESRAKRKREIHWGPRTLDLDILLYADKIIDEADLIIPHIDMCNRSFVLAPLNAIAPGMVHPVKNATIRQLFEELNSKHE